MQRNLDNFSFAEKPLKKSQLYHHEAESTLKNKFCATCGAQNTKKATISESFTKTNQKWPRWSGNETIGICDVIFGELIISLRLLGLFQGCPGVY